MVAPYKIGVALAMSSNHAEVIGALSKALLGVNANVNQLTAGFGKLKFAIAGAFSFYAGEKLIGGMAKMVKHGSELVHQQEMMKLAGMSNREIAEATSKAYQLSAKVQTQTISESLKQLREMRYAFGDTDTAMKFAEKISKSQAVLNNIGGKGLSDQVWPMVKALEEKGLASDPQKMLTYMDAMTQASIATGGRVSPQQFYQSVLIGRTAAQGWDLSFIGGALPRLIQSMGGGGSGGRSGPGNALMSAYGEIVSGQMSRSAAEELQSLGILDSVAINHERFGHHLRLGYGPHGVQFSKSGEIARYKRGNVKDSDQFIANPYEWTQTTLMPAIFKKLSITPGHDLTEEEQRRVTEEISRAFPNRTAGQVMTMMGLQGRAAMGINSPIEKDIRLQGKSLVIDQAFDELVRNDPVFRMEAFNKQWAAMMEAFGSLLVPPAIRVMRTFTEAFTYLAGAMAKHPTLFKSLAVGLGALAGVLVGVGVAAVIAAIGAGGWLVVGIGALVGGLAALTVIAWDKIAAGFAAVTKGINDIAHVIDIVVGKIKGWFSGGGIPKDDGSAWTPGFNPTSFNAAGHAALGGFHSGGGFTLIPGSGGSPLLPGGGGITPKGMGKLPPSVTHGPDGVRAFGNGAGFGGGAAYLRDRRARFARELAADPALKERLAAVVDLENAGAGTAVVESLLNRSDMMHRTIRQGLGIDNRARSFYGPVRRGLDVGRLAELKRHPDRMAARMRQIDQALNGSNLILGHTDQGSRGDPNYIAGGVGVNINHERFNDWGVPGSRAFREHLMRDYTDAEMRGLHGKALRDHFGYRGRHNPDHPSAAIPKAQEREQSTPIIMHLDGDVVGRATMKRMVNGMNAPARGGRSPDFSAIRPISI